MDEPSPIPDSPDPGLVHREVDLGTVRLHVVEAGTGPLVVFLHGFPEFWYSWRAQVEAVAAAGYHAVAPDQRGYNLSSHPTHVRDYRIDRLVEDVIGLLDHLGEPRCVLVGHDWGAMVAWMVAHDHPERVERLIVCNVPHPLRMLQGLTTARQLRKSWYIFFFQLPWLPERALGRDHFGAIARQMRREARHPERWPQDAVSRYREAMARRGARGPIHWYRAALRDLPKVLLRLRRIECPVLVVWGRHDRHLGLELAAPPPRWVPNARLEVLDASHWLQHDAKDDLNSLILTFLQEGQAAKQPSR